jgi:hypothetical protein
MLFDQGNLFSDAQALTGDAASTNVIDAGASGTPANHANALAFDLGASDVEIVAIVTENFNNLTNLVVQFQGSVDAAFSSPVTLVASQAVLLASLVKGYTFRIPAEIPEGSTYRYYRLNYDVTGTNPSTGKITAGIVAGRPKGVL